MNRLESQTFGVLLHDVARLYRNRFNQRAKALGLTQAQCKTLIMLARHEGLNQARLAECIEIEPMTLVRLLDRMESQGWIERRPDPADRRAYRLYVTEKAKPVFATIEGIAEETLGEALSGLDSGSIVQMSATLAGIRANLLALDASDEETAAPPAGAAPSKNKRMAR